MQFRILFQDERLVAIDKPAGFHVHPPEDSRYRIPRSSNCLYLLRKQIDRYLYPVHRLDGATSGVLIFALDREAAANLQGQFQNREIQKSYFALTRGWTESSGTIESPLSGVDCRTRFRTLAKMELPHAVGRYATARYSLVQVSPESGRMHQIRRHFAHLRHPLIGDTLYGDGKQNRFFKTLIEGSGLWLKAHGLSLQHPSQQHPSQHPSTGRRISLRSRWDHQWHRAFGLFGVCPFEPPSDVGASSAGDRREDAAFPCRLAIDAEPCRRQSLQAL